MLRFAVLPLRQWIAVGLLGLVALTPALAAAGRTPATFEVSQAGEATYTIPIAAPPGTGEIGTRQSGTGGSPSNIQNLANTWDTAGNLTERQDLRATLSETFQYDALDRLTQASEPGFTQTIGYDAIGNITSRSIVITSRSIVGGGSAWTYHATKKHAVTSAGGVSYGYDANGNMTSRAGATLVWTSGNLPAEINGNGSTAAFDYAPDRSRWRQVSGYSSGTETTIYVGGLLEKLTTPVRTHWKHLIATPSGQVQHLRRSDGTTATFFLTTDHLGSVDAVLNLSGSVLVRLSYGVWGKRRDDDWNGTPSAAELQAIANSTRRGYTGHEMLDNVGLIHMNGRVYDPAIGRFMSADPFIDCLAAMASHPCSTGSPRALSPRNRRPWPV